jgi:anti-sigma factor RsiW
MIYPAKVTCPFRTSEPDLLLEHSAGRLDPARAALIEEHIEKCPECASFRMEQAAVWNALDLWQPAPVSLDFNRRLWQRIDATPWYAGVMDAIRFANWKPVMPLTAAILVIAVGFLLDNPGGQTSAPGVSFKEASQVEQTLEDLQLLHQLDSAVTSGNSRSDGNKP